MKSAKTSGGMRIAAGLLSLVWVACTATAPPPPAPVAPGAAEESPAGPYPADYETRIAVWLRIHEPDADHVELVSLTAPQRRTLEVDLPEQGLSRGDAVWEVLLVTRRRGVADPVRSSRVLFRDGVIRAVLR